PVFYSLSLHDALPIFVTLFALAAMYVMLDAQFIAALQVLVYAGAIMVLFLFVIMLLNLGRPAPTDIKEPVGLLLAAVLAGTLLRSEEHTSELQSLAYL